MKNQSDDDEDNTREIIATAKFAYRTLSIALRDAIGRLNADEDNSQSARTCEAVVRSHAKSLQQIIDLEVDLAKRSKSVLSTNIGAKLDLDAAREEINSRLVKLAKQRGD